MKQNRAQPANEEIGATVVVTHRVRDDRHPEYEAWLDEIGPLCRAAPGLLDWHIIRPIAGLTSTYTVVIRFDTRASLQAWMESPLRGALIEKVRPLLASGDDFFISSGLDFWFTPKGARARVPARWRQFLVTWSAIFPLVLGTSQLLPPLLRQLGVPAYPALHTLAVTGTVVFLMIYLVMPHYTRLLQRWLFA